MDFELCSALIDTKENRPVQASQSDESNIELGWIFECMFDSSDRLACITRFSLVSMSALNSSKFIALRFTIKRYCIGLLVFLRGVREQREREIERRVTVVAAVGVGVVVGVGVRVGAGFERFSLLLRGRGGLQGG